MSPEHLLLQNQHLIGIRDHYSHDPSLNNTQYQAYTQKSGQGTAEAAQTIHVWTAEVLLSLFLKSDLLPQH